MSYMISNGKHLLSGVGTTEYLIDEWSDTKTLVRLFCIDGKTYGAYEDPDDGYRSYGEIREFPDYKCQYMFPPQEVDVINENVEDTIDHGDWLESVSFKQLIMTDQGREVLVIGTDYTDSYYPMAIFRYTPENLTVNQQKQ